MKKTIALIYGGEGVEHDISVKSAENILAYIDRNRYTPLPIEIKTSGEWYIKSCDVEIPTYPIMNGGVGGFSIDSEFTPVSCAIICLHGDCGEDGNIQGALRTAHIPYIGQDVYACALTSDKAYTKIIAEHLGIPTAHYTVCIGLSANEAKDKAERDIGYPMFIKPARLGSSVGAHPVHNEAEFTKAYNEALTHGCDRILIEELVNIKYEAECAFLETDRKYFIPDGRILTNGSFYGYSEKYIKNSPKTAAVPDGNGEVNSKIIKYAKQLVDFLEIKYLSRLDFFITTDEKILFNEINTVPGMTDTSLYPKLTENASFKEGEFINRLIEEVSL